jgi:hypothetical protein
LTKLRWLWYTLIYQSEDADMKATVTEQTLRDLLDSVGLLVAGMGMDVIEKQVADLRVDLDGEPMSATIYQLFPEAKR